MFVVINDDSGKAIAEIYLIVSDEGNRRRKYGVFLRPNTLTEEEQYSMSVRRIVELVSSVVTSGL